MDTIAILDAPSCVYEGLKAVVSGEDDMTVLPPWRREQAPFDHVTGAHPDVVVGAFQTIEMESIELLLTLRSSFPKAAIVVLTADHDRQSVRSCLAAGAHAYVLKSSPPALVLKAIRNAREGNLFLDPKIASQFGPFAQFSPAPAIMSHIPSLAHLQNSHGKVSNREWDVLRMTARGLTGKEIAYQLGISIKTVETYRARAKAKLELHNRADIVQYATRQGWLEA